MSIANERFGMTNSAYSTLKMEAMSPKRRLTFSWLHGVISQNFIFLVTAGVRTSNPTTKITALPLR
jgi:hypothetical protein